MENYLKIEADYSKPVSDQDLWNQFKHGNRDAFSSIYRQYVRILYTYGLKITPDQDFVRDAIQDLFIDLWKNRDTLGSTDSIRYYLYTCLRRKIIRQLASPLKPLSDSDSMASQSIWCSSYEETIIETQTAESQHQFLQKALSKLTPRQREALFLKYYEGLDNASIAQLMDVHEQSIYNLMYQGLAALRKYIPAETVWLPFVVFLLFQ